ncbi:RNA-directed DNA polymerase, eukaryota [Tanacetum coccineum]
MSNTRRNMRNRTEKRKLDVVGLKGKQSKGRSGGWLLSDRVEITGTITTEQKPTGLASYWGCRNLVGHSARIEVVGPAEIVGLTETDGPLQEVDNEHFLGKVAAPTFEEQTTFEGLGLRSLLPHGTEIYNGNHTCTAPAENIPTSHPNPKLVIDAYFKSIRIRTQRHRREKMKCYENYNYQNHLVGVLGDIVNEVQSAFIAERQILDGPFILNEILQWSKTKKKQSLIFNVDFEKEYDSVRWDFLDDILKKFGFGEKWCKWIQSCLRSLRGSILINGSPTEEFQFYKGLKQGDPLSPFLFFLILEKLLQFIISHDHGVMEIFSTLIHVLNFFIASGLRIKISKSKNFGVNVDTTRLKELQKSNLNVLFLKLQLRISDQKVEGLCLGHAWNEVRIVKVNSRGALENERNPRGEVEQDQFNELLALVHDVSLIPMSDRWKWDLESLGDFSVASVRKIIDDKIAISEV